MTKAVVLATLLGTVIVAAADAAPKTGAGNDYDEAVRALAARPKVAVALAHIAALEDHGVQRLIELTERYCVVYQTLRASPRLGLRTEFVAAGHRHAPVGMEGVEEAEAALQARLQALRAAASHAL